jgi:hypothetical protein
MASFLQNIGLSPHDMALQPSRLYPSWSSLQNPQKKHSNESLCSIKDCKFLEYLSSVYQEEFCSLELAVDEVEVNSLFKLKLQASSDL